MIFLSHVHFGLEMHHTPLTMHCYPCIATLICKSACINHISSFSRKMVSRGHHLFAFVWSFWRFFCVLLKIPVFLVCQHNILLFSPRQWYNMYNVQYTCPQFVESKLFQCHYFTFLLKILRNVAFLYYISHVNIKTLYKWWN